MKKQLAIAILRVSSSKQGLVGDSPQKQKEDIQKILVPKYNAPVVKWIELVQSGGGEIQPALPAIEYVKTHPEIKYCFVVRIDRFSRAGSYYYQHLKAQLAKYGVQVLDSDGVISDKKLNSLASVGKEYKWSTYSPSLTAEIIEAEESKNELRKILTRLIGSEIRYIRLGYWQGSPSHGYITEKIETEHGRRSVLKPHPETGIFIRRMFELRIQGLPDEEIVRKLNSMGYKSKRKYTRNAQGVVIGQKGEVKLTVKQLNVFLTNPIYCLVSTHAWLEKPTLMHGSPIVSVEMFNTANKGKIMIFNENNNIKILRGKKAEFYARRTTNNPLYAYKDYIMCSACKGRMRGSASLGADKKHHPAYHCSRGHKYLRIKLDDMKKTIEKFIPEVEFTDEFKARFRRITLEELEKRLEKVADDSIMTEKTVMQLKDEKKQIVASLKTLSSPVAIKAMEEELEKVEAELNQFTQVRDVTEEKQLNLETLYNHARYYVENLDDLLMGSDNPLQNAAFFGLIFETPPTYDDIKSGKVNLAPLFKLNEEYKSQQSAFSEPDRIRTCDQELKRLLLYR